MRSGTDTQREGGVKTQEEDRQIQDKERGLGRNQTYQRLDLGLLATRPERK